MSTISDEQRREISTHPGQPVEVVDPENNKVYYLISADQFNMLRALFSEDEFDPREMYPLISKTAADAGWADPQMDAYDKYDEHRKKG